jgi:hypothetical protein
LTTFKNIISYWYIVVIPIAVIIFTFVYDKFTDPAITQPKEESLPLEQQSTPQLLFLSNQEVVEMISNHTPIFLSSYWSGMTEKEALEVTRYNMERNYLHGLYLSNGETRDVTRSVLDMDTFNLAAWFYEIKTANCLNAAKIKFSFENDRLTRVFLCVDNSNKQEFEELIEVMKLKFGEPIYSVAKKSMGPIIAGDGSIRGEFKLGYQHVRFEFLTPGSGIEGLPLDNTYKIQLYFEDERQVNSENNKWRNQIKQDKKKADENRMKRAAEINNSLYKF